MAGEEWVVRLACTRGWPAPAWRLPRFLVAQDRNHQPAVGWLARRGFIFPPSELEETFWKVCGWLRWLQRRFLCDSKAAVIGSGVRGVASRLRDPTVQCEGFLGRFSIVLSETS